MTDQERYLWDLSGYLILRGVLDQAETDAANAAIDHFAASIERGADNTLAKDSRSLRGTGRPTLHGLLRLAPPHCEPFRRMLAHPAVAMRLNAMCQPGFRLDHGPLLIAGVKGTEGFTLHGEGEPFRPSVGYHGRNGASYCAGVTVQWQLRDVAAGDGGFACVPGSHKSRYPKPDGVRTADDHRGTVVQPAMRAGDVLFFMDGALTHGTLPWRGAGERRSILFKYASRCAVRQWPDPAQAEPESFWDPAFVDGMTPEQRAVMHGPNSGRSDLVPALTVDADGTVRAVRPQR